MKIFRIISRNIRDAAKSIVRNFSLSIASISCITITLLIVAISVVLSVNVENSTQLIRKDFTIVVFLDNNLEEENKNQIIENIKNLENVESLEYRSKDAAAGDMKDSSDVFKNIFDNWENKENPLYDSLLVKVKNVEQINNTAENINDIDGINLVRYGEDIVENLLSVFKVLEKALIIIVLSLVFVTAFLISNTIKITIFSRKREIEIMRLVGASNLNIKLPFVIEGLFLGIIGAFIPIMAVVYGYSSLYNVVNVKLSSPFLKFIAPEPFIYILSLGLLGVGIIVGMIGSARAVKKHLKI